MKTTLHIILIAALSLFSKLTYSQVFTDLNSQLPGLESGSAAWADYDNDGDLDLAMAGFSSLVAERSFIFRNDNGIMNPVDSSIIKVSNGSVNWADFDNDGDMDLLINGQNNGTPMCELYRNDSLTFVPMNPGFVRTLGCMKWLDIDNDGFQDVLIAGVMDSLWVDTTIVYRNNGNSTFSYFPTNLPALLSTGIDVADYDNDSLPDIFIIASNANNNPVSALFHNTGSGNFTIDTTSFHQIFTGAVKWGDADSDGDLDILYDGIELDNDAFTLIYLNDGSGNFSELITNLPGTGEPGSVDWADIDNDGDHDVLLSSNLMRNDGSGNFTDISPWASLSVYAIPAMFMDFDQDSDADIFMLSFFGINSSNIYRNELFTGVTSVLSTNNFSVFPNPANDFVNISFEESGMKYFSIYSVDGKLAKTFQLNISSQVNLLGLKAGMYFLEMKSGAGLDRFRLVVE